MKISLCLSGQPRYIDQGYEEIYKNILSKYSVDVFVHTWWDDSMPNKKMELSPRLTYGRNYTWKEETLDLISKYYSPKVFLHQPQLEFETYSDVDYELCKPSHVHSMFYSIKKSNKLKIKYEKENNFTYDVSIRCRFDVKFNKFEFNILDLEMNYINCDTSYGGLPNDQFAISSSENMNVYSDVYSNLKKYKESGWTRFCGERLLAHHLENNKLRWDNESIKSKIDTTIIII